MTTRHVSAETDYPFEPDLSETQQLIVGGILDLYFVVQGPPSSEESSSNSSSEPGPCEVVDRRVYLEYYEILGAITRFGFACRAGDMQWDVVFDVPNTGGATGQVRNTDDTDVDAVLLYNTDNITDTDLGGADFPEVEPSRAQFHIEQVDTISFLNIGRCAGSEYPDQLFTVLELEPGSSSGDVFLDLDLEDGYNCEVEQASGEVVFSGQLDAGEGLAPDFGDTIPSCSENPEDVLEEIITNINGLAPVNGDIPINVSRGLGTQRVPGRVEVIPRF